MLLQFPVLQSFYLCNPWLLLEVTFSLLCLHFCPLLVVMCAEKWNVEEEPASHPIVAISSTNVNVKLAGGRLALLTILISSSFLAYYPTAPWITLVRQHLHPLRME
uniref:Uncharacterized protein n=1 Tax=Rhizophora mucronata TaxID=61149 RepID=A0A2P2NS00_RHIMU